MRMNLTEAALGDGRVEVPLSGRWIGCRRFQLALTSNGMLYRPRATLPPPCRRRWLRFFVEWRGGVGCGDWSSSKLPLDGVRMGIGTAFGLCG